jgi:hypothetical protein
MRQTARLCDWLTSRSRSVIVISNSAQVPKRFYAVLLKARSRIHPALRLHLLHLLNATSRFGVKFSLWLIMHNATKKCGKVEVQLHAFFSSALDGDLSDRPNAPIGLTLTKAPPTKWRGGWVSPKTGSGRCGRECLFLPEIEPIFLGRCLVAVPIQLSLL